MTSKIKFFVTVSDFKFHEMFHEIFQCFKVEIYFLKFCYLIKMKCVCVSTKENVHKLNEIVHNERYVSEIFHNFSEIIQKFH